MSKVPSHQRVCGKPIRNLGVSHLAVVVVVVCTMLETNILTRGAHLRCFTNLEKGRPYEDLPCEVATLELKEFSFLGDILPFGV